MARSSPSVSTEGEARAATDAPRPLRERAIDVGLAALAAVGITALDFATGAGIDFSLIYVFPIAWVAWRVSRSAGLGVCALSSVLDTAIDLHFHRYRFEFLPVLWNMAVQLGALGLAAVAIDRIRAGLRTEHTLGRQLGDAYARLDDEMKVVGEIQRSLLPPATPPTRGLRIAVDYAACERAGGDYYDFLPLADGRLGVLVADASGHGASAAVIMAMTRALVHANPESQAKADRLLEETNQRLIEDILPQHFLTACYVVFDPASGTAEFALAGHPRPLLRRAGEAIATEIVGPSGPPLGIDPAARFRTGTLRLEAGDVLVLYSDGLTEARASGAAVLGDEAVLESLAATAGTGAAATLAGLVGTMERHLGGQPALDDVTILVLERDGPLRDAAARRSHEDPPIGGVPPLSSRP